MLSILLSCTQKYTRARARPGTWPCTAGQPCPSARLSLRLPAGTKPGLFPAPAAAVEGPEATEGGLQLPRLSLGALTGPQQGVEHPRRYPAGFALGFCQRKTFPEPQRSRDLLLAAVGERCLETCAL